MLKLFRNLHLDRPLAVVDLETTGTDPRADRIVEVAAIRFEPGRAPALFETLVQPGRPIPPAATAVHRLTDADVVHAPRFAEIAGRLAAHLADCDLAGFHLGRFDLPLLAAEFARTDLVFTLAGRAVVDTLRIFHAREPRDLAAAVRFYCGREHAGAHGAAVDAAAAAEVLDAQLGRYGDLPRSAADLHAALVEVDVAGKFRLEDGRVVLAFGKHAGRDLDHVAGSDPSYLTWLLGQGLLDDAERLVRAALSRAASRG